MNNDDDLDLDLDDVVSFKTNAVTTVASSIKLPENGRDLSTVNKKQSKEDSQPLSSQPLPEEWGSDEDESHFFDINVDEPEVLLGSTVHNSSDLSILAEKRNNSILSEKKTGGISQHEVSVRECVAAPVKRKFPGPAGLPLPSPSQLNNNPKAARRHQRQAMAKYSNLTNLDGLQSWDKALSALELTTWRSKKMNLETVKKTFARDVIYLTAPLLILGIQRVDYAPVIKHDVDCMLQDPTGEIKGRILQQVIVDYGKLIEVGAILVLRRPSVLQFTSNCLITITPNCLFGIYSHQNSPQMTRCRSFSTKELNSWLSESIVCGNPVRPEDEEAESASRQPPAKLFTSVTESMPRKTVAPPTPLNSRPANPPAAPFRYNTPSRPPPAGHQFQPKAPSAVTSSSTPRPAPYNPPSRPPVPVSTSDPSVMAEEDQYLSQFLDGVDTDALFSDDFSF